jgi:tetratricopeptide (TPR) repeat protein
MQIRQSKKIFRLALILVFFVSLSISPEAQKRNAAQNPLIKLEKNINNGKYSESEQELFAYVIANPKDARGFALFAILRLKTNRLSEAKSLATKALVLDANLISAKLTLAESNFALGEIEQSNLLLNEVLDNSFTDSLFLMNLAKLFVMVGNYPKALEAIDRLPAKIKNSDSLPLRAICLLRLDDAESFAALIPLVRPVLKQNPTTATKFADVLIEAKLFKEAADLLNQIIKFSPKNTDAIILLAKSEIYLRDFVKAKNHIANAQKLQPKSLQLALTTSLWESEQGNNLAALSLIEQLLTRDGENKAALSQLVIVAIRANQSSKAFRNAEKLLALEPENLDYLYLFGAASLQNNRLIEAENALTKFFTNRPNDSRGCLALGLTFAAQPEKTVAARSQMQKCMEIDNNNSDAAYQLGLSYKAEGDITKAIEFLEATVKISPDYAPALRDLGTLYLQSGGELKARPILEKAVLINPTDADTHFQLSRLYNLIGERELAKKHLEIFQKLRSPKKDGM